VRRWAGGSAAGAVLLTALLAGCGWHAGVRAPDGAETVGVAFFGLDTAVLQRDIEPALQDAMSRALADLVDARLVSPDRADLIVSGRIRTYQRRGGIHSKEQDLLETAVRITVEAELRRRSTGEVLARSRGSLPSGYVTADAVSAPPADETSYVVGGFTEEARARDRALRILAEGMVLDLFAAAPPSAPPDD
jgi:hypothetical protein